MALILVVDDAETNFDLLKAALSEEYALEWCRDGFDALARANLAPAPDLILLDVMMPDMDGYEVCRLLKQNPVTSVIPVLFLTQSRGVEQEEAGFAAGAVDYIIKPFTAARVRTRVRSHLALSRESNELRDAASESAAEVSRVRMEIINRLGRAAEYRDNETGMHVIRMSHYVRLIAQAIGMSESWCELLFTVAPMHDIGKIGIPDAILSKPGQLTLEEWDVMKQHPVIGAKIIGDDSSELLRMSREVALYHHERWDGLGYPHGLAGAKIPLSARIIAVADVFDALTSVRPYKVRWTHDAAFDYLREKSGQHLDPDLVRAFIGRSTEVLAVMQKFDDNLELGTGDIDLERGGEVGRR